MIQVGFNQQGHPERYCSTNQKQRDETHPEGRSTYCRNGDSKGKICQVVSLPAMYQRSGKDTVAFIIRRVEVHAELIKIIVTPYHKLSDS